MAHRREQSPQGQGRSSLKTDTSTDSQRDCNETLGSASDSASGSLPQKTEKAHMKTYDGPAWTETQRWLWNSQYTFKAQHGDWPDRFHCEFFQMFQRWPDYAEMEHYKFHGIWPYLPWWWHNVFGKLSEAWAPSNHESGPLPEATLQWHNTSGPRYLSWKRWQDASRPWSEAPMPEASLQWDETSGPRHLSGKRWQDASRPWSEAKMPWHDASGTRSQAPNPSEAAESTVTQDAESQEQTTCWKRHGPTGWDESNASSDWW